MLEPDWGLRLTPRRGGVLVPGRLKNRPPHLNGIIYRYPPSQIQLPSTLDMATTVPIAMSSHALTHRCNKFCHHVYVLCGNSDVLLHNIILIEVRNDKVVVSATSYIMQFFSTCEYCKLLMLVKFPSPTVLFKKRSSLL